MRLSILILLAAFSLSGLLNAQWGAIDRAPSKPVLSGSNIVAHQNDDGVQAFSPTAGTWKLIAQVREFAEFDPTAKRRHVRNPPFPTISLEDGGKTSSPLWAWSGDTLMNLDRYEALKMRVRTIGDEEFLLMESGGFNTRHKPDWKSRWYVLERETTKR